MFIVYDTATGKPISIGTIIANPLPAGLSSFPVPAPDQPGIRNGTKAWDPATRTIVVVPADPTVVVEETLNAEFAADLAGLRLIIDSTGTLTGAQLSNAARLLARCVLKLGRLVLRKLDATN